MDLPQAPYRPAGWAATSPAARALAGAQGSLAVGISGVLLADSKWGEGSEFNLLNGEQNLRLNDNPFDHFGNHSNAELLEQFTEFIAVN